MRDRLFSFYLWCAGHDDIPELISLAKTISRWEDQIVCAVITGVTNAASESPNRLAKLEARQATDGNPGKGTTPVNLEGPRSLAYDQGMPASVSVQTVHPRKLAAVRREVAPGEVGSAWGPAVGKVWDFIRSQPGLWTDGHNIFLYHHSTQPGAPVLCDFGVEVTRRFETAGEVYATETPGGEAAVAVHRGPYDRMNEAYNAIDRWMAANRRESAGHSWEVYGDPTPDPAHTETMVVHLLKYESAGPSQ